MISHWKVEPNTAVDLKKHEPGSTPHAPGDRKTTEAATLPLHSQLLDLQGRLWAEHKRSLLVIIQGIDAAGKDGTVSHVFQGVNPLGTRAVAFKAPTPTELEHDFLWRIHAQMPAAGNIGIFNRSQYEDVLVPVVHKQISKDECKARYRHIIDFESLASDAGTAIIKFFLHISKAEQAKRLQERIDTPDKRWKVNPNDLKERALWDDYQSAFEAMLSHTSTDFAPWHIIPADHKWYRNYVVSTLLIDLLNEMNPQFPEPPNLDGIIVEP